MDAGGRLTYRLVNRDTHRTGQGRKSNLLAVVLVWNPTASVVSDFTTATNIY